MNTDPLVNMLHAKRPLILDGAMGTELQRRNVDVSLPLWSARSVADNPDTVLAIHRAYLDAGADIITTNTFRTTARTYRRAGLTDQSEEYTRRAVALAIEARSEFVDRPILIAGSLAPLEDCYRPELVPSEHHLLDEHANHAYRLAAAGVDFILLETMGTVREARAACQAAVLTGKEVVVSFLFRPDGRLYGGDSLDDALLALMPLKPAAFSLNCVSPRHINGPLLRLLTLTDLPVAVYANVGIPGDEQSGSFHTDVSPEEYAEFACTWVECGAAIVGGCCGTTPEHIGRLAMKTHKRKR
jgi:S-methylmethionine-dependent homocysteine/selenocysteine methylase